MRARILFISAFFLASLSDAAWSQYISDGGILYIGTNSIISTTLPFQNDGFTENEGVIVLRSNWINNGIYQGSGILRLEGSELQQIQHNGQPVSDLVLSNPSGARLEGRLPIQEILNLENGILTTSPNDTLFIDDTATLQGGSPVSFIDGPLHRGGRGERFFPTGRGNTYLPVTLANVSGGNTIIALQVLENYDGNLPQGISRISRDYFWQQSSYRETYSGSEIVLPLYDDQLADSSTVILGFDTEYNIYDELGFSSGPFYREAVTNEKISESIILLATAEAAIRDENVLYVPNVLSATASDPENRVIKVYGDLQVDEFEFVVYDRRGIEVFATDDLNRMQSQGWNGNANRNGELLPQGSYVYALRGMNLRGEMVKRTGTITLLK